MPFVDSYCWNSPYKMKSMSCCFSLTVPSRFNVCLPPDVAVPAENEALAGSLTACFSSTHIFLSNFSVSSFLYFCPESWCLLTLDSFRFMCDPNANPRVNIKSVSASVMWSSATHQKVFIPGVNRDHLRPAIQKQLQQLLLIHYLYMCRPKMYIWLFWKERFFLVFFRTTF